MSGVIVVDAESFRSTCHGRNVYIPYHFHEYHHNYAQFYQLLDSNSFTNRNTYAILREATSETYGPRVYSHHINLYHFIYLLCFYFAFTFYFASIYQKNTKNTISIRSHSRKWPCRD